jgi:hypothetical protein
MRSLDAWYDISFITLRNTPVWSIYVQHGKSPYRMLSTVFPEHKWEPWKLRTVRLLLYVIDVVGNKELLEYYRKPDEVS